MIEVRVSDSDYPLEWSLSQPSYEAWIMGKLISGGIPLNGILVFGGIKEGRLTVFRDKATGEKVFRWKGASDA